MQFDPVRILQDRRDVGQMAFGYDMSGCVLD